MRVAFVRRDPVGSVLAGVLRPSWIRPARDMRRPDAGTAAIPARVDIVDKGDRFGIKVDLPGVSRDDIHVAVDGAQVSVSAATRPDSAEANQITVLHAERRKPKYARTVHLPAAVDGDAAEAVFENGVLTLSLPKRSQPAQITVR